MTHSLALATELPAPHPAEAAAAEFLRALGVDLDDEGRRDTPRRIARLYSELLTPEPFDATTFPNDGGYDELVVARGIPFHSLCEHHLLPFAGVAHVGYLPGERIVGLSKLARVVDHFARALQVQERLTTQVAGWLQTRAGAQGRRRGARGRAHVHDDPRRAEARGEHGHLGAARAGPRRPADAPGVPHAGGEPCLRRM